MMDRIYHVLKRKHNTIGLLGVDAGKGFAWIHIFPLSCAVTRDVHTVSASLRREMRISV